MNSNTNDNTIDIATMMLQRNTTAIDWSDHTSDSSIFDSSYTYSNDKYSCVKELYHIHLVFNYFIFVSGLVCLVSRLIPASNKYHIHAWSGRIYILAMLWSTSASLLINNEGLPVAVLVSFVAVMGGLTIGWIVIIVHKQMITKEATVIVQKKLIENMKRDGSGDDEDGNKDTTTDLNLNAMMNDATMEIVKSQTFVQRFFSLKSMHGILFFVSWMQIAGRIFNSGDGEFSCRSYPVYKPIEAPHIPDEAFIEGVDQNRLKLMNVHDPNWEALPWSGGPVQWSLLIIMASAVMAIIGGVLFSLFFACRASSKTNNVKEVTSLKGTKHMNEEQNQEEDEEVELTIENQNNININHDSTNNASDASLNNTEDDNSVETSSSSSSSSSSWSSYSDDDDYDFSGGKKIRRRRFSLDGGTGSIEEGSLESYHSHNLEPWTEVCDDSYMTKTAARRRRSSRQTRKLISTTHPYQYQISLYIQMELCHPATLQDWIMERNRRVPDSNYKERIGPALEIFQQICSGLAHIHKASVIHRDLKPANIFVCNEGKVIKIGDFGLSKQLHDIAKNCSASERSSSSTPQEPSRQNYWHHSKTENKDYIIPSRCEDPSTQMLLEYNTGGLNPPLLTAGIGTASYAAPEQVQSKSYDTSVDIYSLGLIFLELVCCFETDHERLHNLQQCRYQRVPKWIDDNYPDIATTILACTRPKARERPKASDLAVSDKEVHILKGQLIEKEKEIAKKDAAIENMKLEIGRMKALLFPSIDNIEDVIAEDAIAFVDDTENVNS